MTNFFSKFKQCLVCLLKHIYCPPHHRLQSANSLSPKAGFIKWAWNKTVFHIITSALAKKPSKSQALHQSRAEAECVLWPLSLGRGSQTAWWRNLGRNSGSPRSLYRSTITSARWKAGQESREATAHTPHVFSGGSHSSKGQTVTEMIRGMKRLSYKERFRELSLLRLEKRRVQCDFIAAF